MFLPRFDILCVLSEYRPMEKWNMFVLYNYKDIWPHFRERASRWLSQVKNFQANF